MERLASALFAALCFGSLALNAQTAFEWIPRAPYPGTGYMGAFTFVLDGKGYVAGGYNGSNAVAEVWMYDPETDVWMTRQSLPSARRHGTSWTMNGKGYVVCGFNGSSVRTNTLYEYDPVTDTWNVRAPLPGEARYGSHGFAIGSNGYVGGGNIGSASGPFLSDMWRYDSANNDWVEIEGIPGLPRYGATSWVVAGKGYVQGGCASNMDFSTQLWQFDPTTSEWSLKPPRPGEGLSYTIVMAFPYTAVVACGKDDLDLNNFEAYHYVPSANVWSSVPDYPGQSGWSGIGFGIGDRTFGGLGATIMPSSGYFNDFWELVKIDAIGMEDRNHGRLSLLPFPVPASGDLVSFHVDGVLAQGLYDLEVINVLGQHMLSSSYRSGDWVDITSIGSGQYTTRLMQGPTEVARGKLVVLR